MVRLSIAAAMGRAGGFAQPSWTAMRRPASPVQICPDDPVCGQDDASCPVVVAQDYDGKVKRSGSVAVAVRELKIIPLKRRALHPTQARCLGLHLANDLIGNHVVWTITISLPIGFQYED